MTAIFFYMQSSVCLKQKHLYRLFPSSTDNLSWCTNGLQIVHLSKCLSYSGSEFPDPPLLCHRLILQYFLKILSYSPNSLQFNIYPCNYLLNLFSFPGCKLYRHSYVWMRCFRTSHHWRHYLAHGVTPKILSTNKAFLSKSYYFATQPQM